jgi:hypothetical protein
MSRKMKRSLEIAGSDEDSDEDDEDQTLTLGGFNKGSYDQKPHGDPLKVQALGRYLETCGGSATLVQSWTCVVKTRTTSGDQWVEFMDEANRRFRSQREVALHFGLQPLPAHQRKGESSSSSSSTALATVAAPSAQLDAPFTEEDAVKMTVVWATVKGYPPWPAEVMRTSGPKFTVRFFATDNEATLVASALKRYHKKQLKLRAGQGKVANAQLQAQFFEAVKLADVALLDEVPVEEEEEQVETEGWRLDGSAWIGRRVRRIFPGGVVSDGVVQRWLPAGDTADDFALWHVQHDDGDEEDLEEAEVRAGIQLHAAYRKNSSSSSGVKQRKKSTAEPEASDEEEECLRCGQIDSLPGNEMLLCDGLGCKAAYHLKCLVPPLERVPAGEWLCSSCRPGSRRSSRVPGRLP